MLILGKALSGGLYPVSAVLTDDPIMEVIRPGQHGSTFGGNPLASAIAVEALQVLIDERLVQNARAMGVLFRNRMQALADKRPDLITSVRGRGLLNAVVINDSPQSKTAWNICLAMADKGILAKPTHGNIIRFAPPLVIDETAMNEACQRIEDVFMAH
jgi:ornithine--oxo-acid transaminase